MIIFAIKTSVRLGYRKSWMWDGISITILYFYKISIIMIALFLKLPDPGKMIFQIKIMTLIPILHSLILLFFHQSDHLLMTYSSRMNSIYFQDFNEIPILKNRNQIKVKKLLRSSNEEKKRKEVKHFLVVKMFYFLSSLHSMTSIIFSL